MRNLQTGFLHFYYFGTKSSHVYSIECQFAENSSVCQKRAFSSKVACLKVLLQSVRLSTWRLLGWTKPAMSKDNFWCEVDPYAHSSFHSQCRQASCCSLNMRREVAIGSILSGQATNPCAASSILYWIAALSWMIVLKRAQSCGKLGWVQ